MTAAIVSAMLLAMPLAPAAARHPGEYLRDVSTKVVTPHTPWAKPYARGPLRVLIITPQRTAPREIVELWQRLSIEFDAVLVSHSTALGATDPYDSQVEGTSPQEKEAELRAKLARPHDAIIIANVSMDALPVEAQYKILRQVADGTGLLICYRYQLSIDPFRRPLDDGRDFVTGGTPWTGLPFFAARASEGAEAATPGTDRRRAIQTYAFGKGRIAVLDYGETLSTFYGGPGMTPRVRASIDFPTEYDYYMSLVMRALLWTVPARMPRLAIAGMPADGTQVDRDQMPLKATLTIEGPGDLSLDAVLWHRVRNLHGDVAAESEQPVRIVAGKASADVAVPRLPAGTWFLDAIVRAAEGAECWGSSTLHVRAPVGIEAFSTERESYEEGQSVASVARLTAPAPRQADLVVELIDTAGRLFARGESRIAEGAQEARVELPLKLVLTLAVRARGSLRVGDDVLDRREAVFYVPRRTTEELPSVIWGTDDIGLMYYQWQQLRRAGFNAMLAHPIDEGANFRAMALADLMPVVYSYRICGGADASGVRQAGFGPGVGDDSFSNPAYREAARAELLKRLTGVPEVGPLVYSIGDENNFDYESGFSPHDVAAFRTFLQQEYGSRTSREDSLAALNASWGTDFGAWEDVVPLPHKAAIERGQYAAVHDHYSFLEYQYAEFHRAMRDWIREIDPHAKVGAEGSEPGNLEESIKGLDLWSPYSQARDDVLLASLAPPTLLRGNWWGGYVGSHGGRGKTPLLWEQLLRGLNSNWWFATDGCEGLTQAGFGFAPYFEAQLPQLEEIFGGIGQLLAAAQPVDDGIAIYYSMASEHASRFDSRFGTTSATHTAFLATLRRLGLNARYVTPQMITTEGALAKSPPAVLFLLHAQAVSAAEADAIRAYVEGGGTVIADIRCGVMDGHCKPVANGALDDLFGIRREGDAEPATRRIIMARMGNRDVGLDAVAVTVDPSVRAENAFVLADLDGAPVFVGRAVGRGRAILLNFNLGQAIGSAADPQSAIRFVEALLATAKLAPRFRIEPSGVWELRALQYGDTTLVGLLRQAPGSAALVLPEAAEAYDVRAGRGLGRLSSISLSPDDARDVLVFALLKAAPEGMVLDASDAAPGGAAEGKLSLKGGPSGSIVRLRVRDPAGDEVRVLRRYLRCEQGQAAFGIPIAFNDQPGRWTVSAADVATGITREATFRVRKGAKQR